MQRRGFLLGLGTALAAPAVVRASSLMKLWVPPCEIVTPERTGKLWSVDGDLVGHYTETEGRCHFKFAFPDGSNSSSGSVSNATMFRVMVANDVTPYWPRPFA